MGNNLASLKKHPGWEIVEGWLEQRAFHAWVDPKEFKNKEDWVWAEMNLYHNADVARTLLDNVENSINQSEYLRKKEAGELDESKFDAYWKKVKNFAFGKEE